jgi:hypothetical protein
VCKGIFDLIKKIFNGAKDETDEKEGAFGGKYKYSEVKAQLEKVLTALAACQDDCKFPDEEEKKEDKKEDEKKEDEKKEDAKEGGDADKAAAGGNFCDELLKQVIDSSVLFDILKSAVLSVELDSFDPLDFGKLGKMAVSLVPILPDPKDWAGAVAILCVMVNSKESEPKDQEIWAKMKCTEDDLAELKEASDEKDKCALIFPGLSVWAAEESGCAAPAGPEANKEVTFKIKNSSYCELEGKMVICRYIGKIEEYEEKDGKHTVVLSEFKEYCFENFGALKAKIEAAGGEIKDKVEDAKKEDEKKEDPPK